MLYYFLIEFRGAWWVNCRGRMLGPYTSKDGALADAIKAATVFDEAQGVSIIGPNDEGTVVALWRQLSASSGEIRENSAGMPARQNQQVSTGD